METIFAWAIMLFIIFLMLALIYILFEKFIKDFGYYIRYKLSDKIKPLLSIFKPKTELDREIAEEEKEIKFLTEQKAKIDRLERLKREKDRLYQEVIKDEKITHPDYYKRTKPLFKTCGLCGNAFVGDHCECLEEKTSAVDPIPYLKETERYSCPQCGSTKVTGRKSFDRYVEFCSDCATPINDRERVK